MNLDSLSSAVVAAAEAAVLEAGSQLAKVVQPGLTVAEKANHADVVTEYDSAVERMLVQRLRESFPGSAVCGEELGMNGDGPLTWFIDPIDGTSNFATGMPMYCVSVGAAFEDELIGGVVYDPSRHEMFTASRDGVQLNGQAVATSRGSRDPDSMCLTHFPVDGVQMDDTVVDLMRQVYPSFRGIRRIGSQALSLAYVATGRAEVTFDISTHPWDCAAGFMLVLASGGHVVARDSTGSAPRHLWDADMFIAHAHSFSLDDSVLRRLID